LKGKVATEIKSKLDAVLGNSPSFSIVSFWISNSSMHTSDELRSGRPKTAPTTEIVDKIHDKIHFGGFPKLREIEEAVDFSYERIVYILHV